MHWKKSLMLGKTEGSKRRGNSGRDGWMASLTVNMSLHNLLAIAKNREA